jgi:2-amino-4-hydroxy-6-hydroxymethyldihydropteridine diphosphokinase
MPTTPLPKADAQTRAASDALNRVFIGLGSNLNDPTAQVLAGFQALGEISDTALLARSGLYLSQPMGPVDQPAYVNAAAAIATRLRPHDLLDALQGIEQRHGRFRHPDRRWGPRTLDLDILVYSDWELADRRLTLPHPGIHLREFVLYPLAEIAPDICIPGRGRVRDLARAIPDRGIVRLAVSP